VEIFVVRLLCLGKSFYRDLSNGGQRRTVPTVTILFAAALATSGAANALTIKPVFDSTITSRSNAGQIEAAFNSVAAQFDHNLSSPATVNLQVSWGRVDGATIPSGVIGASRDNLYDGLTYSQVSRYLTSSASRNPLDTAFAAAVKTLPTTAPSGVNSYVLPSSQAKALGLIAGNQTGYDGYIGFNSAVTFDYSATMAIAGAYDFYAVAAHEIEEALGRMTGLDDSTPSFRSVLDLYRYAAPGQRSFAYSSAAYLSLNGGSTSLGAFNIVGAGDRSDWRTGLTDAQLAYTPTGVTEPIGVNDWKVLDALGWNQTRSVFLNALSVASVPGGVDYALAAPVPEPATWTLMMGGIAFGGARVRRRRGQPAR
jgi:hypothetical protein